ncbi:stage II sporulation protein R [Alkaliphilus peptidifermentans]|uniref:Stage II sporulation protein R n=1 Tax=Alkaliphilus peptidifermentans DSM 18978 TaxID=1120976 RepID=A0A1G5KHH3_9FIRM|nr:stage II sporulation protein R [Alkaliphilus peptidifermentans]SCZ00052.1 stage II sporulation protein R [Alkaliphilus peptidifermentans DSM 18978]
MKKKKIILLITSIFILGSILSIGKVEPVYQEASYANKSLIRFHVLANSDSSEDQLLKLKVKNQIITQMAKDLEGVATIEESREIIANNLLKIQEIAREELKRNEKDFPVKVSLGQQVFPTRKYGDIVLAAGSYEALKVEIGEGKGQNWWCVMFPPLCFIDVKNSLIDEETKNQLKEVLTEEEYQMIISDIDENELPLQLRSKLWDLFKSSRNQIVKWAKL